MREQVIEFLKSEETSFEFEKIMHAINPSDLQELIGVLNELEEEGIVYRTKRDKFMLFEYCHLKRGRLDVNQKGFGFVITNDGDIYISEENMNGALNNDIVNVELLTLENDPKPEGKILKVVKRNLGNLVGEFYYKQGKGYIDLDDPKIKIQVEIDKEDCANAVNGHKVLVSIVKQINNHRFKGQIAKIIGHKDDPGVDIISEAYKHEIDVDFPPEAIEELSTIPSEVVNSEIVGRRDLRDKMIFTIDGDDTKDIDDAISMEKLENGNYKLGVHIADVSHYVTHNSELDKAAQDRGTSVYLANTVIPMLPHQLSNGICSLNPNVDRLAVSVEMEINSKGDVVDYDIFESVIKSNIQMTYKNVNKILEEKVIPDGYEQYVDVLNTMMECSDILRQNKIRRGYIDFGQTEVKVVTDETGKPIDIKPRERGIGENMIEDFMIVTNETVATHVNFMELPFVYRIHEYPNEEKIDEFLRFVSILGYKITGKRKDLHPKRIQEILKELSDKPEYTILSSMLLRSMKKAIYSKDNLGHYGLASERYTHFTSPIRRYPDLTIHKILKEIINGRMTNKEIAYWEQALIYIADHSSQKERASIECERDVDDMKMAEYMEEHIGEEYTGMISSLTNFGMFVQLDNLVEGLVHVRDMKDDNYIYDDYYMILKGERTGKFYKLGDTVNVRVKAASKENKTIDFELVKEKVLKKDEKGI